MTIFIQMDVEFLATTFATEIKNVLAIENMMVTKYVLHED